MAFPHHSVSSTVSDSVCQVLQPQHSKLCWFGLFPVRSPLLGEYSLFLWVLRCFSSPGSLHYPIYSDSDTVGSQQWVIPFGNPRLNRLFAAHRGLSQRPASFFGTWRQGIHRKPLVASACDTENLILFHAYFFTNFLLFFDALAYNTILLVRFCCAFSCAVWLSRFRQCHTAPDKLFSF